jgi:hypothetical protein
VSGKELKNFTLKDSTIKELSFHSVSTKVMQLSMVLITAHPSLKIM